MRVKRPKYFAAQVKHWKALMVMNMSILVGAVIYSFFDADRAGIFIGLGLGGFLSLYLIISEHANRLSAKDKAAKSGK